MKKKLFALLLCLCMVLTLVPTAAVFADTTDVWDGSVAIEFAGGDGTSANPYQIATGAELAYLASLVNDGTATAGKYYVLTADIDLNNQEWTPIGGAGTGQKFNGKFDGADYTISNLQITKSLSYTGVNCQIGLFGSASSSATIENFTLNHVNVLGSGNVAAVLGDDGMGLADVTNVHVTGNIVISGYWYVGGIVGNGYATVTNCSVKGDGINTSSISITGGYVGGIVGFMGEGGMVTTGCTVQDITIQGAYNGIGGVNGILHYGNTISNCTLNNVVVWQTTDPDAEDENRIYCGAFAGTYLDNNGTEKPTLSGNTFSGALYCGTAKNDVLEATRYVGSLWYGDMPPATVNISNCLIKMPTAADEDIYVAGDATVDTTNTTLAPEVGSDALQSAASIADALVTTSGTGNNEVADSDGLKTLVEAAADGDTIKAELNVTVGDIQKDSATGETADDVSKIQAAAGEDTVSAYFDVDVALTVTRLDRTNVIRDTASGSVTKLNDPVSLTVTLTGVDASGKVVKILYVHNGVTKIIIPDEVTVIGSDTVVTFGAFEFSTYAVVLSTTCDVTFDSQGGSAVADESVTLGATVTEPTAPTRGGYTFNGWYTDPGCTSAYDFNTPVSGATLTLYAGWTLVPTYAPPVYRNDNFETATGAFNDMAYYGREAREGDIVTLKVALSELGKQFGLDLSKIEVKYEVEGATQITDNYLYTGNPIYVDGIATDFRLGKGVNVIVAHIYYNGFEAGKCAPFHAYVNE